jgi:GTP-binding protein
MMMVTGQGEIRSWRIQRVFLSLLLCAGLHLGDGFCISVTSSGQKHVGLIQLSTAESLLHSARCTTSTTSLWAKKKSSTSNANRNKPPSKTPKLKIKRAKKIDKKSDTYANAPTQWSSVKKNPMAQKTDSGATNKKSLPPWQVLSKTDASKNVVKEIRRRDAIKEGTSGQEEDFDDDIYDEPTVLSKAFLSEPDKRLLNWKRFAPDRVPAGMRFVGGYLDRNLPPRLGVPEVAFLGRSNVGKSSLLNRLSVSARSSTASDSARVGKTPGATASVNLYALQDTKQREIMGWVDLPGFGYAKLSKETKESVQLAAEHYLGKRQELMLGILLVDIRRTPSDDDRAVLAALFDQGLPIIVVATKVDKVNVKERDQCLKTIRDGLGLPDGQPLSVSSTTGEGTRDLWRIIMEACESGVAEFKQKYDKGAALEKFEDDLEDKMLDSDSEAFEDSDDIVYSQGFDWIHDSGVRYEGDDNDFVQDGQDEENDEDWEDDEENLEIAPQRETIVSLRRKARDMERKGQI